MTGRIVVELSPEEWANFEADPGAPIVMTVECIELRQGILAEELPVAMMNHRGVLSFAKPGGLAKELKTPGPGPWLEVWTKNPNREESRGEHGDGSTAGNT